MSSCLAHARDFFFVFTVVFFLPNAIFVKAAKVVIPNFSRLVRDENPVSRIASRSFASLSTATKSKLFGISNSMTIFIVILSLGEGFGGINAGQRSKGRAAALV